MIAHNPLQCSKELNIKTVDAPDLTLFSKNALSDKRVSFIVPFILLHRMHIGKSYGCHIVVVSIIVVVVVVVVVEVVVVVIVIKWVLLLPDNSE